MKLKFDVVKMKFDVGFLVWVGGALVGMHCPLNKLN